jgi:hypothetical protein
LMAPLRFVVILHGVGRIRSALWRRSLCQSRNGERNQQQNKQKLFHRIPQNNQVRPIVAVERALIV